MVLCFSCVSTALSSRRAKPRCCASQQPSRTANGGARNTTPLRTIDGRGFVVPNVGELIIVPGKWPGQEEVGLVEGVQLKTDKTSCVVDVVELRNVGRGLYAKPRQLQKQKRRFYDVGDVRVATATYVEAQDAYRVENVKDGYPDPSAFDESKREQYLKEYIELKQKLLREAALSGAVGTLVVVSLTDVSLGVTFASGAASGVLYLALLQRSIDRIEGGTGLAAIRFLLPFAPFLLLIARELPNVQDPSQLLFSLSRRQVLAAAFGFLTYRLPIFYQSLREVAASLKAQDVKPRGTLSTVIAAAQQMGKDAQAGTDQSSVVPRTLVVLSGCSGVGKSTMIKRLLRDYGNKLVFSVSCTTRPQRQGERDGVDYNFVDQATFERKIERGEFIEWAKVHDNYYGTSLDAVQKVNRVQNCPPQL